MFRNIRAGALGLVLIATTSITVQAQDSLLADLYGRGVHAYNSGNHQEAFGLFTEAIDNGSHDPRCYYFRGLSYEKLGRPDEAAVDFKTGAESEVANPSLRHLIGPSLERIQGGARLSIESARRSARLIAHREQAKLQKARYVEQRRLDSVAPEPPPAATGQEPDFGSDFETTPKTAPPVVEQPTNPAVEPDPFGNEPPGAVPTTPPAGGDDPFGNDTVPPTVPTTPPAGTEDPFGNNPPATPPAGGDDPFGAELPAAGATTPEPADDDPFGEGLPAAPAAPAPAVPAPGGDDPFGNDAPAPAVIPAVPAPAVDDPFGNDAPAPAPAGIPVAPAVDDPFGNDAPAPAPAGIPVAPAVDDPFGNDAPAPVVVPAAPAPAPVADDPFAEDAPAAPAPAADVDDPFAN